MSGSKRVVYHETSLIKKVKNSMSLNLHQPRTTTAVLQACLEFSQGKNVAYITVNRKQLRRVSALIMKVLECIGYHDLKFNLYENRIVSLTFSGVIMFMTSGESFVNKTRGIKNVVLIKDL